MADDMFFLEPDDRRLLKDFLERLRNQSQGRRLESEILPDGFAPDVFIAKLTADIPARSGTTPGRAQAAQIWYTGLSDETSPTSTATLHQLFELDGTTEVKYYVYNVYPIKIYSLASPYVKIYKDRFGFWYVEKPRFEFFGKSSANIASGSTGTVTLYAGSTSLTDTVSAIALGAAVTGTPKYCTVYYDVNVNNWYAFPWGCP